MEQINQLALDTPLNIIWNKPAQGSIIDLANEIKTSLSDLLNKNEPVSDADLAFMQASCVELDQYLQQSVLPEINKFKRSLSKFSFKSPLNFIMVEEDFHRFYQMYYHAKSLMKYTTNFLTDRSFSLHNLHTAVQAQG